MKAILFALVFSSAHAVSYQPNVEYDSSCNVFRPFLDRALRASLKRLESCVNFAYVEPRITDAMSRAINTGSPVRIRCEEPADPSWCAQANWGEILLSPSQLLAKGSFCNAEIGHYIVHEFAHLAGLKKAPGHDERGETPFFDQVYSLQNYCMHPARNWLQRSTRTADVVMPSRLACMRWYQEQTPTTLTDPFWEQYFPRLRQGKDPCWD